MHFISWQNLTQKSFNGNSSCANNVILSQCSLLIHVDVPLLIMSAAMPCYAAATFVNKMGSGPLFDLQKNIQ